MVDFSADRTADRRRWPRWGLLPSLAVAVLVLGVGCGPAPSPVPPAPQGAAPSLSALPTDPRAQQLPITATTTLGSQTIFLEVATTPQQQSLGLMYRDALPPDRGMLFPISPPRPVSFWMKNVPVAIDMVFIRQGQIQAIEANVPPCAAEPCPTYGPRGQTVDQVLELRAGRAAELGLAVGDGVVITPY